MSYKKATSISRKKLLLHGQTRQLFLSLNTEIYKTLRDVYSLGAKLRITPISFCASLHAYEIAHTEHTY